VVIDHSVIDLSHQERERDNHGPSLANRPRLRPRP
jgi:hypothetical protein